MSAILVFGILGQTGAAQSGDVQQRQTAPQTSFATTSQRSGRSNSAPLGQSITLTANLFGGYDDNAGALPGSAAGSVPQASASGSTGLADVMVEYLRRSTKRSLAVRALGNVVMYPEHLDAPAPGGKARISGTTQLGRKHKLQASAQVRYEPLFTPVVDEEQRLVVLSSDDDVEPLAVGDAVLETRLFERRSWVSSNKAYLTREWTRRDTTVVSYLYYTQRFKGEGGDNQYQEAAAQYQRRVGRRGQLSASYKHHDGRYTDYGSNTRPVKERVLTGGAGFGRLLSGRRQLSLSFSAGATHVESVDTLRNEPYDRWTPYATGSAAVDLILKWKVHGGYRRGYSVLQGLTGEVYSTDAVNLMVTGPLRWRIDLAGGGTFAGGRTMSVSGPDAFKLYGASLHARVGLTPTLAATASYTSYFQRYSNPAALPTGFPARYDRHAVMIGLTFSSSGRLRAPGEW